jgi:fatty acyl-CoA reductase
MRAAAFFDVDGTILQGDVVRYYAHLCTLGMSSRRRALWMAGFVLTVPYYFLLDKWSRRRFQAAFYRNYARLSPLELEARVRPHFERFMVPRLFPGALRRIAEHQQKQDLVVLVTGSLRPIVEPLAARLQASELIAPQLQQANGAFTGDLVGGPLSAERKAEAAAQFAARHGLDPRHCHAYADSLDDLPLLRRVGHASVVNPGGALRRIAAREGWEILRWEAGSTRARAAPGDARGRWA